MCSNYFNLWTHFGTCFTETRGRKRSLDIKQFQTMTRNYKYNWFLIENIGYQEQFWRKPSHRRQWLIIIVIIIISYYPACLETTTTSVLSWQSRFTCRPRRLRIFGSSIIEDNKKPRSQTNSQPILRSVPPTRAWIETSSLLPLPHHHQHRLLLLRLLLPFPGASCTTPAPKGVHFNPSWSGGEEGGGWGR